MPEPVLRELNFNDSDIETIRQSLYALLKATQQAKEALDPESDEYINAYEDIEQIDGIIYSLDKQTAKSA